MIPKSQKPKVATYVKIAYSKEMQAPGQGVDWRSTGHSNVYENSYLLGFAAPRKNLPGGIQSVYAVDSSSVGKRRHVTMAALATGLNFCGISVEVRGEWDEIRQAIRHDFGAFCAGSADLSAKGAFCVELIRSSHDRGWKRLLRGPRSSLFIAPPGERRVCFFDKVSVCYRYQARRAQIWSLDSEAAFEALYYVLLSYVGERLDERGWHRLHGFGFSGKRRAVVLATSGTGKVHSHGAFCAGRASNSTRTTLPWLTVRARLRHFRKGSLWKTGRRGLPLGPSNECETKQSMWWDTIPFEKRSPRRACFRIYIGCDKTTRRGYQRRHVTSL